LAVVIIAAVWAWEADRPRRLISRAETAAARKDWLTALREWRGVNQTAAASARTYMGEAKACLSLDRAGQAERALSRAIEAEPEDSEPWLIELEILRVEDRPLEAGRVGWAAYDAVPEGARRSVLRALTLALLADTPDELARRTLKGWVDADLDDVEARVALLRRMSTEPRDGDIPRSERIAQLNSLLERDPNQVSVRAALIMELADAGEPDRGRKLLEAWPLKLRDARYARIRGRWDLDYDHQPERAVELFRKALIELPHDWRTHYRLARALSVMGKTEEARAAAETVARLREVLDPHRLTGRINTALRELDEPRARLDLAELCGQVGLEKLAEAWRRDARSTFTNPALRLP
jgi:thioredoxin-like negative regulator of GroEL